jgi:CheY-like chemotaxis protein
VLAVGVLSLGTVRLWPLFLFAMEAPDSGRQLVQRLRADPTTSAIPIIVSSGDVRFLRQQEQLLLAHGCELLTKPYGLDTLLEAIDRLVTPPRDRAIGG